MKNVIKTTALVTSFTALTFSFLTRFGVVTTPVLATGGFGDQCNQEFTYEKDEDNDSHYTDSRVEIDFNGSSDDRNQVIITADSGYKLTSVKYDTETSGTNWMVFSVSNPTTTINLAGNSDSTRIDKVEVKVKKVCNPQNNVTLCHKDGQSGNYNSITINVNGSSWNGHDGHSGDIIPAFDYLDNHGQTQHYPGKNLTVSGQAILNSNCNPPVATPTPTSTPTNTPAPTPTDCPPTPTGEVTPTPTSEITPTPSEDPEVTPTQEVTPTPTSEATPTPTSTPSDNNNNSSNDSGNGGSTSSSNNSSQGQVLAASTMAATGVFDDTIMNLSGAIGSSLMALSFLRKKQK